MTTKTLPQQARIVAGMIALGEHIAWGRDTELLIQLADQVEALTKERDKLAAAAKLALDALEVATTPLATDRQEVLAAITALRQAGVNTGRKYAQQAAAPYDQQALELCDECGWKAIMPGEPCFVCNMKTEAQQVDAMKATPEDMLIYRSIAKQAQQVAVPSSDFDMRGVLASNLLCWHRLTEAEEQDLICFFEKVCTAEAQGEKQ